MTILIPAALAPLAKANSRSGVRCAETMCLSLATPSVFRVSAAWRIVSQSDWLPMMMATGAGMRSILSGIQKHRPDYKIGPWFGKAWQGVGNGLSCLGEFRQAFLEHDNENWLPFSVNDDAQKDTEWSDWRAHEEENRAGERRVAPRPHAKRPPPKPRRSLVANDAKSAV